MKLVAEFLRKLSTEDGDLEITFKVSNWNYKSFCNDLKKQAYTLDVKPVRSKRSLNQNAYFWALVNEIDETINGHRKNNHELYCQLLEMADVKYEYVQIVEDALPMIKEHFRAVKVMKHKQENGNECVVCKCFYGSSNFDKEEMSRLIEVTLDYAAQSGVDTTFYKEMLL